MSPRLVGYYVSEEIFPERFTITGSTGEFVKGVRDNNLAVTYPIRNVHFSLYSVFMAYLLYNIKLIPHEEGFLLNAKPSDVPRLEKMSIQLCKEKQNEEAF